MPSSDCQDTYFQVVAPALGKGEVHSSILCGSTTDLRPINSAFNHKIRDLARVAAVDFVLAAHPVSTRTKREAACQLTQNWHAESCFVRGAFSDRSGGHAGPDHGCSATPGHGKAAIDTRRSLTAARRLQATHRPRSAHAAPSPAESPATCSATGRTRRNTGAGR